MIINHRVIPAATWPRAGELPYWVYIVRVAPGGRLSHWRVATPPMSKRAAQDYCRAHADVYHDIYVSPVSQNLPHVFGGFPA